MQKYELEQKGYIDTRFTRQTTAFKSLNEKELDLVLYMIIKATANYNRQNDTGWTDLISVDINKLVEDLGHHTAWKDYSCDRKDLVYENYKSVLRKSFTIIDEAYVEKDKTGKRKYKTYEDFTYFQYFKYIPEKNTIDVRMAEDNRRVFCRLQEEEWFTVYTMKTMLNLNGKYSKILYLFFKSYENKGRVNDVAHSSKTIEHLRELLGVEGKYKEYKIFKRDILLPAIYEINSKTDIFVNGKWDSFLDSIEMNNIKKDDYENKELTKLAIKSMEMKNTHTRKVQTLTFRVSQK